MADLNTILTQLQQGIGGAHSKAQQALQQVSALQGDHALIRQELQRQARDLQNVADAVAKVTVAGGGNAGRIGNPEQGVIRTLDGQVVYIESIPGRRIPFDLLVTIPIGTNINTEQQQTTTVSQDGPFVAMARYASFESALQFQFRDPETQALSTFQGRSFGRFRPIHSAWDINDAGVPFNVIAPIAFPGSGACVYASPSNHSSFRTMEFDGFIEFLNAGSGYHRSNQVVPSTFWSSQINSAFQLGALDFFERGETLQWKVTPTHVNNPPAGNVVGIGAGGVFPFLDSQYDVHEGICDPQLPEVTVDPVTRLPDGFLIIGFHGFRIIQPPGPVRLT